MQVISTPTLLHPLIYPTDVFKTLVQNLFKSVHFITSSELSFRLHSRVICLLDTSSHVTQKSVGTFQSNRSFYKALKLLYQLFSYQSSSIQSSFPFFTLSLDTSRDKTGEDHHLIRWTSTYRSVSHAIACFESAKSVMKRLILLHTVLSAINYLTIRLQTTDLHLFQSLDAAVECCERLLNQTNPGELLQLLTDQSFGEARESHVIRANDTFSFVDDLITNLRRDMFDGNHLDFYLLFGSLHRKRKPSKEAFLSLMERYKSAVSLIQLPTVKS
ncbi:hypothetical protein BLNAU_13510 [Blattamonas nauphoetae]|uniref:Uncharacterized protein n=1 Tax=Blattamonas nauphoetae TaxID=2049346 RepID=A0ABQ9XMZ4_9EUKA|nr:hypothetical protein BLNAU_13510 [Blattamonas nauphoetae]